MLGKMIIQGLVAAVLIGAGAAVYAQSKGDNVSLDATAAASAAPHAAEGNGRLTSSDKAIRKHDERNRAKREDNERPHDGHKRGHDDDDD